MSRFFMIMALMALSLGGCHQRKAIFSESLKCVFFERSQALIGRLDSYHRRRKAYASDDNRKNFTDLGLDPAQWQSRNIGGLIYAPRGNRLLVRPAKGYTIFIKDKAGVTRIISSVLGWDMIFDLLTRAWYLQYLEPGQMLDIATFTIKKDLPYRP